MARTLRSRLSVLFAAGLLLAAAVPSVGLAGFNSAAAAPPTLDHFQCYAAASAALPSGAPAFPATPPAVLLNRSPAATFLPPSILAATLTVQMHCNPVAKKVGLVTTPITNPNAHLVCWGLKPNAFALPAAPVLFNNQFGTGALKFLAARSLCLPSWKSLTIANLPPSTAPAGLDHFTCFAVVNLAGTPSFKPPASVTLTDQFFSHPTAVGTPNLLCSPTSKVIVPPVGTTIVNPNHYLVCFTIPPSSAFVPLTVYAKNQFGTGGVKAIRNTELCVPSIIG
jgi:hypothetical protein